MPLPPFQRLKYLQPMTVAQIKGCRAKPNPKDILVADVRFIFSEVERLQAVIRDQGVRCVPKDDAFCHLPDPEHPGFFVLCGRAADIKVTDLARQAARRAGMERRMSHGTVKKHLRQVLARKFMIEKRVIEIGQVERSLAEASRLASQECKTTTHFIPCHLMLVQEPETFSVGPVRFMTKKRFRSEIAKALWAERRDLRRDRKIVRDAASYYRNFGWVAEVTIPMCDKGTSEVVARRAITSALDCLHLLLGPEHSRKMRIGGPGLQHDKRGGFKITDGGLELQASYGGPGHVGYDENWFKLFDRDDYGNAIGLCGLALEAAVNPDLDRPLSRRFLDAVAWFGEAVREESPAARVVKYVTALERMLMTDEANDIAKLVSERVAAVCFDIPSGESFEKWRSDTQRAYALRSKLVHGALSSVSPEILDQLGMVASVSSMGLQGGLALLGEAGLRAERVSTKKLSGFYNRTVAHCRSMFALETGEPTTK